MLQIIKSRPKLVTGLFCVCLSVITIYVGVLLFPSHSSYKDEFIAAVQESNFDDVSKSLYTALAKQEKAWYTRVIESMGARRVCWHSSAKDAGGRLYRVFLLDYLINVAGGSPEIPLYCIVTNADLQLLSSSSVASYSRGLVSAELLNDSTEEVCRIRIVTNSNWFAGTGESMYRITDDSISELGETFYGSTPADSRDFQKRKFYVENSIIAALRNTEAERKSDQVSYWEKTLGWRCYPNRYPKSFWNRVKPHAQSKLAVGEAPDDDSIIELAALPRASEETVPDHPSIIFPWIINIAGNEGLTCDPTGILSKFPLAYLLIVGPSIEDHTLRRVVDKSRIQVVIVTGVGAGTSQERWREILEYFESKHKRLVFE